MQRIVMALGVLLLVAFAWPLLPREDDPLLLTAEVEAATPTAAAAPLAVAAPLPAARATATVRRGLVVLELRRRSAPSAGRQ
jgi:hypothetical protein